MKDNRFDWILSFSISQAPEDALDCVWFVLNVRRR